MNLPIINIADYTYSLPDDRIALHPLEQRDHSKLLVYQKGTISHETFNSLPDLLPGNATLFFNNTRVIRARFLFHNDTGAQIEVFLLEPVAPSPLHLINLGSTGKVTWKCAVGNQKRWKDGTTLQLGIADTILSARLLHRDDGLVELSWSPPALQFAKVIEMAGAIPLPPYIKREVDEEDSERYQTVYAHHAGAVAAPTAGLHFTENVLHSLESKGILLEYLTLHVSAGTFLPVKALNAVDHTMHSEQVVITRGNLERLLMPGRKVIAVGTTSLRTLESLYWYGVKLHSNPDSAFQIEKLYPYSADPQDLPMEDALQEVLKMMIARGFDQIAGSTSIYIFPGYRFRICKGLITNFHQPGSTLLLLIAAFVGKDWEDIYQAALQNNYRFLSYGDSSLLIP